MQRLDLGDSALDVRRMSTSLCRAREKKNFQPTGLLPLFDTLAWGDHLILKGPKGAGKTINIEQWAFQQKVPFMRMGCTGETGDRQLLGRFVLKSFEESWYALGTLAAAIDVANETGRCVLAMEEINALTEEAQKAVNSVADYRREVSIPSIGLLLRVNGPVFAKAGGTISQVEEEDSVTMNVVIGADDYSIPKACFNDARIVVGLEVKEGDELGGACKLWIVGTMNPDYGGTYDLNEDFQSRFGFVDVLFMPESVEKEILHSLYPGRLAVGEKAWVQSLQSLAKTSRAGKWGYALSTRDLEQAVNACLAFKGAKDKSAGEKALKLLEGKFPTRHIKDFQAAVRSTFKSPAIDLTQVKLY